MRLAIATSGAGRRGGAAAVSTVAYVADIARRCITHVAHIARSIAR